MKSTSSRPEDAKSNVNGKQDKEILRLQQERERAEALGPSQPVRYLTGPEIEAHKIKLMAQGYTEPRTDRQGFPHGRVFSKSFQGIMIEYQFFQPESNGWKVMRTRAWDFARLERRLDTYTMLISQGIKDVKAARKDIGRRVGYDNAAPLTDAELRNAHKRLAMEIGLRRFEAKYCSLINALRIPHSLTDGWYYDLTASRDIQTGETPLKEQALMIATFAASLDVAWALIERRGRKPGDGELCDEAKAIIGKHPELWGHPMRLVKMIFPITSKEEIEAGFSMVVTKKNQRGEYRMKVRHYIASLKQALRK